MTGPTLLEAMFQAPLIGVSARWPKVLHAISMEEVCRTWDGGTVRGVCGRKHLRIIAQGDVLVPWPPALKGLGEQVRCRDCWIATGKKRPKTRRTG